MNETDFSWNLSLFHWINASDTPNHSLVLIARVFAEWSPWLAILILLGYWFIGGATIRRALMVAGVALVLGMATNLLLAASLYAPRPFALGVGNNLLSHGLESSFPSDHATFLWALGFGLLVTRPLRLLGIGLLLLGLATAWARVCLGVHFPLDMLASMVISLSAAFVAHRLSRPFDSLLFERIERIYSQLVGLVSTQSAKRDAP